MAPETNAVEIDITSLEMEFAKNPGSEAFLALSEAYLSQERFMEAMVVCKKGIKSNPDQNEGRFLLARIYGQQGKYLKAFAELDKIVAADAANVEALLYKAELLDKKGDNDDCIEFYKKTLEADPTNEKASQALEQKGISYTPASAVVPEPEPVAATPVAAVSAAAATPAAAAPAAAAPVAAAPAAIPTWTPPPSAGSFNGQALDPNQGLVEKKKRGPGVTLGIIAAGVAILGVFFLWFALHARELRKIDQLNKEALSLVSKDTARTLGDAIVKLDEVLKLDDSQSLALGVKAFALAVRGYEHGIREDRDSLVPALKAAQKGSKTSWRYAAEIISTHHNGDPEAAEKLGKEIVEQGYGTVQTYAAFACAAVANGHLDIAREALKKSREKGPTSVRALVMSAEFYRRMLDVNRAQTQYSAAIKSSPDNARALVGSALLALENPTRQNLYFAYKNWQTTRDIGRANIGPYIWGRAKTVDAFIAKVRGKNQDSEQSMKDAIDGRSGGPQDADVLYMLGRVKMLFGKNTDAINYFKKSIKVDPYRISSHVFLARSYSEAGKNEEASKELALAKKLNPDSVQVVISEAISMRKAKKYTEAIKLLRKAAEDHGGNVSVQMELLDTLQIAGKHADVVKQFAVVNEKFGEAKSVMSRATVTLGQSFLRQRDLGRASGAFNTAVEMDKKNAEAYFFKGYALRSDKKSKVEAYAAFMKYLELAPQGKYAARAKKYADSVK